ncbi:Hsp70 family protein [Candidatus Contendibacter odensensis]|uniref:Heat shock protein 70 n=1 Tax=Candidatus Contendobacter odensis Run_B_J11 TaxID=1400861 RepID=A0A7U7J429_9GAMM|nr:Hsp70 family protein [Candidatus Contendobacter odensis]CDH44807.1 Heat shock protein 70 [Candidatus Contendobacter odensis Run_B_J11]
MAEKIIGIDLGTTNSEVAVVENGRVTVIDVTPGHPILPSFVGLADDGSILVGEPAKNQYVLYPERTIKSIKRRMGSADQVEMGDTAYTPQEISAIILRRLKAIAEAHLGEAVHKAVITVPAYFSDAQRQATREAGEIAGLEVARIINEPTAAALSYEANHQGHKKVLVYDLGGGTFDVSVVGIEDNVVEVLASHGNNQLGGDDFDAKIVEHLVAHLQQQGADPTPSRKAMARITRAAEIAKIALSDQPYCRIEEEYLLEKDGTPVNLTLELARDDYEAMIAGYIDETLEAVHIALKGAHLTVSDLDEVLLVGGATRTPIITQRLEADLGLTVRAEVNPDLCVATGAAIQAGMLAGEAVSAVLVDITPYTFGTSALSELNGMPYPFTYVPIIHKNTPIPVTKSEVFYTMRDHQEAVKVDVYQGEDPDALNNITLGEFMVENLSRAPANNPIIIQFALDLNGIMQVTAREKNTGLEKSIRIDNVLTRFQEGALETARARVNALFADEMMNAATSTEAGSGVTDQQLRVQAQALVEKAERLLDNASEDDREEMINLIETIKDALSSGNYDALAEPVAELSDILFYLES